MELKKGIGIHCIHERGRGPAPFSTVLTHGFPDSILRFSKLIPLLADPAAHGGDAADSFDVVAPSLPGYAFSDRAASGTTVFDVGDMWHELMVEHLRYPGMGHTVETGEVRLRSCWRAITRPKSL